VKAILGEKLGMTQIFAEDATAVPVTVIKAGPCRVVQIKRPETDGYAAIQISYREVPAHKITKPMAGHYAKAGVTPARHLVEVRVDDPDAFEVGEAVSVGEVLEKGMKADVAGVSKGKGFSGVMKRHNFAGQGASHGGRPDGRREDHGDEPRRRRHRRRAGPAHGAGRRSRAQGRRRAGTRGGEVEWLTFPPPSCWVRTARSRAGSTSIPTCSASSPTCR
jgi:50S ribosomal protein uL3